MSLTPGFHIRSELVSSSGVLRPGRFSREPFRAQQYGKALHHSSFVFERDAAITPPKCVRGVAWVRWSLLLWYQRRRTVPLHLHAAAPLHLRDAAPALSGGWRATARRWRRGTAAAQTVNPARGRMDVEVVFVILEKFFVCIDNLRLLRNAGSRGLVETRSAARTWAGAPAAIGCAARRAEGRSEGGAAHERAPAARASGSTPRAVRAAGVVGHVGRAHRIFVRPTRVNVLSFQRAHMVCCAVVWAKSQNVWCCGARSRQTTMKDRNLMDPRYT